MTRTPSAAGGISAVGIEVEHLAGKGAVPVRSPFGQQVGRNIAARRKERSAIGEIMPQNSLEFGREGRERGFLHAAADRRRALFAEDQIDRRILFECRLATLYGFQRR